MKHVWMCQCSDADNAADPREKFLADHLAYIESVLELLLVGGALRDENETIIGSCLIYDVETLEQVTKLMEDDPYFKAGVWSEVKYSQFRLAAGEWAGGMPLAVASGLGRP